MPKKLSQDEFIERAKRVHGNKYDYSKVEYINYDTKIKIICPHHGEFLQTPDAHLHGKGCIDCGGYKKLTDKTFLKKAKKIYGDKYDYSKVKYKNAKTKICIICPEHGAFFQIADNHLRGHKCPHCGKIQNLTTKGSSRQEAFLRKKLLSVFSEVKINYNKDPRYPFCCDFYIPERDLFLEYNGYWTHGDERCDRRTKISQERLNIWQSSSKDLYKKAVLEYSKRDVLKRKTAKKNNLNYVVLWNEQDIEDWFALGCPDGHDGDGMYTWKQTKEINHE